MRNFDEQRALRTQSDRGFQIGGEKFTRRASVRPEATKPWEDVTMDTSHEDTLAALDETICNLVEPGPRKEAHKRWKTLREREEDAVTLGDLLELVQWLVGEMAGRPTLPPLGSFNGPEGTGTSSTDGSSSPETLAESTA